MASKNHRKKTLLLELASFTAGQAEHPPAAVHRRAERGGQCVQALRTAALPSSALHRLCPLVVWGASVGGGCAGGVAVPVLFAL